MKKKEAISKPFKFVICFILFIMVTGTAFGQFSVLGLHSSDLRLEFVYSNGIIVGYNLFVRKGPGMESVMLTEPSGNYALRSLEWNPVNGSERRELSGIPLSGAYSSYSILSSTPVYDRQFGSAFHLFIPLKVVYGSPTSLTGAVYFTVSNNTQINIRTFDHKYADPNIGRFQNNLALINTPVADYLDSHPNKPYFYEVDMAIEPREVEPVEQQRVTEPGREVQHMAEPTAPNLSNLKIELLRVVENKPYVENMSETELRRFLKTAFIVKQYEDQNQ